MLELLLEPSLDELFPPTPLALGPLAEVSVRASPLVGVANVLVGGLARRRHLGTTLVGPSHGFIADYCASAP
jgi:hypothetical protein